MAVSSSPFSDASEVVTKPIPFGKYYLLDRISSGGMAEVFRAKAFGVEGFERVVAVKRILPGIAEDTAFISMFIDEAKIAVQLSHANIAQIFDLGKVGESYFIALEYIHGKDLRTLFRWARANSETLPIPLACYVAMKVCEGLDYAHNKLDYAGSPLELVHRDVSPQNILVSFDGEVKLIDFGIAKAAGKAGKTRTGVLKGKFGYLSPEQVRGESIDRRSDVFAVGICLYEFLSGERLFAGESDYSSIEKVRSLEIPALRSVRAEVPEELEAIVHRALQRDLGERYASANQLHDDLQAFLRAHGRGYGRRELSAWMRESFPSEVDPGSIESGDQLVDESELEPLESAEVENTERSEHDDSAATRGPGGASREKATLMGMAPALSDGEPDEMPGEVTPTAAVPPPLLASERAAAYEADAPQTEPPARPTTRPPPLPRRSTVPPPPRSGTTPPPPPRSGTTPPPPPRSGTTPPAPPRSGTVPPASGTQPPAFATRPPSYGTQPPSYGTQPPSYGTQPPSAHAAQALPASHTPLSGEVPASAHALPPPPMSSGMTGELGLAGGLSPQAPGLDVDWDDDDLSTQIYDRPEGAVDYDGSAAAPVVQQVPTYVPPVSHSGVVPSGDWAPRAHEHPLTVSIEDAEVDPQAFRGGGVRNHTPLVAAVGVLAVTLVAFAIYTFTGSSEPAVLQLATNPVDAQVTFDGAPVEGSVSPYLIPSIEPGRTHAIEVSREGYQAWSQSVMVNPGQRLEFTVALQPAGEGVPVAGEDFDPKRTGFAIESSPPGAEVYLNGDKLGGVTPMRVTGLRPGAYELRMELSGYQTPPTSTVDVKADEVLALPKFVLSGEPVTVHFESSPAGASVRLVRGDEVRNLGSAPVESTVVMGGDPWTVEMRAPGHVRWSETLALVAGESEHTVSATLREARARDVVETAPAPRPAASPAPAARETPVASSAGTGVLRINSRPWSEVHVDGKSVGHTPQMNIRLSAGTHQVLLVNSEFGVRKTLEVTIRPGETETRIVTLE